MEVTPTELVQQFKLLELTVSKDSTNSTTVSESPTSVTYGSESASVFSVAVTTHYGEAVPDGETVTTTVGSVTCKVWLKGDKGHARSTTRPWPSARTRCRPLWR